MAKLTLYLFGKHSKRTPFAYQSYRSIFEKRFDYSTDPFKADVILTGFIKDFNDDKELIHQIKSKNPSSKLVVISEEPVWDTIWTPNFTRRIVEITCFDKSYTVHQINHYNSNVFEFSSYPYYLTTHNRFFTRYCSILKVASKYSEQDILTVWNSAPYKISFIAEKRLSDNYAKSYPEQNTWGLSKFRTDLALNFTGQNNLVEGKGWHSKQPRQDLPDWHLDKLVKLNKASTFISAIENTYYKTYVTEKLFDAYACLGIPVYVGGAEHGIRKIIKHKSWIDLYGLNPKEAFDMIDSFVPNSEFVQAYIQELQDLAIHFSDSFAYISEREQFSERFSQLLHCLEG
ncbi:hypothetical protein HJG54_31625 [Leptolyngbya sp. NK1-12]|uniref:Fucosyltransferase C-terminal domain-containing protein n=1 Tax=Leptolyngbya sp. NK1-12 TaxID=2547451 RepID=A0AA96WL18_9CYAN|nr:hypothetical protein HJG54_31625 [Leptolyngbya sp. NK1-12]